MHRCTMHRPTLYCTVTSFCSRPTHNRLAGWGEIWPTTCNLVDHVQPWFSDGSSKRKQWNSVYEACQSNSSNSESTPYQTAQSTDQDCILQNVLLLVNELLSKRKFISSLKAVHKFRHVFRSFSGFFVPTSRWIFNFDSLLPFRPCGTEFMNGPSRVRS